MNTLNLLVYTEFINLNLFLGLYEHHYGPSMPDGRPRN